MTFSGYLAYELIYFDTFLSYDRAHIELYLIVGDDGYVVSGSSSQERWPNAKEVLRQTVYSFLPLGSATSAIPPTFYSVASTCSPAIESRIDGEFEGWDGETIFPLTNGQIWQQVQYAYIYSYKYRPSVTIYSTVGGCTLKVNGVNATIRVQRIE